ncbi:hypothetical protein NA57DRAFT_79547 [Rhizodiscina lignyota]|uniref:Sucrose transporter n=1 Tax=Rhizodiscina lignyota TaxID=1504668 RepID=A0A9P4I7T7_9PEZI|nr:hypothetical protein NA57DRAFT_79547 [Rhizodiscina lignyota]
MNMSDAQLSSRNPSKPPPPTNHTENNDKDLATQLERAPKSSPALRGTILDRHEDDRVNEQSPLLDSTGSDDNGSLKSVTPLSEQSWNGNNGEETKSSWYLFLLTFAALGLQIGWSVETSNGSPYLLSLGLSKSILALVWIAGPLAGVLVQPYVGIRSDRCRSRWGKRRPFIVGGSISTVVSLMVLAWTRELVGGFLSLFGADPASKGVKTCIMLFAVVFVYVLDFAINVLQAAIRAFIVDCAPTHQQSTANAWASRIQGVGNITGYIFGFLNLPKIFPFLGDTQFKVLCAIASFLMLLTSGISCASIQERDPRLEGDLLEHDSGIIAFFKSLYHSIRRLPPQITKVCQVQFAAWIGWFPFLFYITTYIGEIYAEPFFEENPHMTEKEVEKLWEKATRMGTFALLIFAITTFVASVFLPMIVAPSFKAPPLPAVTPLTPTTPSANLSGSGYFPHSPKPPSAHSKRIWNRFISLFTYFHIRTFTLRRMWFLSHIFFSICMLSTFFIRSVPAATILVGFIGIPWAVTNWAPFALISAEISKRDAIRRGIIRPPATRDGALLAAGEDNAQGADQAGVVLGIHNVALSAPQVIATLISSAIFWALQKPRGTPGDESVAWTLRFAGVCALGAAWLARRVGEEDANGMDI